MGFPPPWTAIVVVHGEVAAKARPAKYLDQSRTDHNDSSDHSVRASSASEGKGRWPRKATAKTQNRRKHQQLSEFQSFPMTDLHIRLDCIDRHLQYSCTVQPVRFVLGILITPQFRRLE